MFRNLSYKVQKRITIISFLILPVLFLIVFTFIPAMNMIWYSFTDWNGYSLTKRFIGFANYKRIFTNPANFKPLFNSLYYFFGGLIQIAIAFYFAVVLNSKVFAKNVFKGLFFFPYLINSVAISLIFVFFFQPQGTLDAVLKLFGITGTPQWLGNPHIANYSLAATSIWRYFGYNFIIFLGAIQSIPDDIIEAAVLDGASAWQRTRYITIPSVKNIIKLNLILNISGAISVFEIPYIMTSGANGTNTFVIQTVNTAFTLQHVGLASAMAVVVLIIVSVTTILSNVLIKGDD
ncbi:sugar ABC transporter permease [[Clostridium] cellulosi]|uniref:Sugar ABC transporter permease n=1 Tax=[Clostridium] cellulosi TaxID=29343 RepID=A0A078KRH4_9FIRM|nr:sugar ABC transporter permease [[Clostridium] cellulosi]